MVNLPPGVMEGSRPTDPGVFLDTEVGKLKDKYKDYLNRAYGWYIGIYKIYPDGRQEPIDEGELNSKDGIPEQAHLSKFISYNKYKQEYFVNYPNIPRIWVLPSQTDPENSFIISNGEFLWKYNYKKFTNEWLPFVPGNQMETADPMGTYVGGLYLPAYPRVTNNLGVFYLGTETVWRHYRDKYYQDLGIQLPWLDKLNDWQVDEYNRKIYYLTTDGYLKVVDFSHKIPKVQSQTISSPSGGTAFTGSTFKVVSDRDVTTIWGIKGSVGPYYKGSKLYVPIDPVAKVLKVQVLESGLNWLGSNKASLPLRGSYTGIEEYVTVDARQEGSVIQKHMAIDELLDVIFRITGQRYNWRFDEPTNTLYLEKAPLLLLRC